MFKHLKLNLKSLELVILLLVLLVGGFLRFSQLGYSHFYGDETKTLYVRKDVAAADFIFNQRKGPVQFLVAWSVEKITGGFDEGALRTPFAIAGFLSIPILYFLVKELFDTPAAIVATTLFAFNGFYIAFSRTAQYQSFLVMFGLLGLLCLALIPRYIKIKNLLLVCSGLLFGLALLSHYDALFFMIPASYLLLSYLKTKVLKLRYVLLWAVPFAFIVAVFYVPYVFGGYFKEYTSGYLSRRATGDTYIKNNSLYTYGVYNGTLFSLIPLLLSLASLYLIDVKRRSLVAVLLWFQFTFVVFTLFFINPGTHIHNYFLPLMCLAGAGFSYLYSKLAQHARLILTSLVTYVSIVLAVLMFYFYVPAVNNGYPWKASAIGGVTLAQVDNSNHLFLYGFPYYRGWDKVGAYFAKEGMPRSFYTNDNVTIASFYLPGVAIHKPHPKQMPEYYILVRNNQEFRDNTDGVRLGIQGSHITNIEGASIYYIKE